MSREIQLPEMPSAENLFEDDDIIVVGYYKYQLEAYARAAVELDRASRPAGEAVAWDFRVANEPRWPGDPMREALWDKDEADRQRQRGYKLRALFAAPPAVSASQQTGTASYSDADVRELVTMLHDVRNASDLPDGSPHREKIMVCADGLLAKFAHVRDGEAVSA